MMKINRIIPFVGLICSFVAVNAIHNKNTFSYEYDAADARLLRPFPWVTGVALKKASCINPADSIAAKRFKDAAERGEMYWYLRSKQEYKYFSYKDSGEAVTFPTHQDSGKIFLNLTKESLDSVAQQVGYIAADALISEATDRVAQLELVNGVLQSAPVKSVSAAISEENKKFLKDQAIFVASASLVNGAYQLSEKGQALITINSNFTSERIKKGYLSNALTLQKRPSIATDLNRYVAANLYNENKGGMSRALAETVVINSIDHFLVKKYITDKDLKEASPLVSWALCNYILFPAVESLVPKK